MEPVQMIKRELKRRHMANTILAKKLMVQPSAIHGMLSRETIHVHKLLEISEVLQYNFFREIAQQLPYLEPEYEQKIDIEAVKAPLLLQIRDLQLEVNILRQTLKDLTAR